jgi:O-antigen/teichoic acid export membrane protein
MTSVYMMKFFKQSEEDNDKNLFNITFYLTIFNLFLSVISYGLVFIYFKLSNIDIPLYPFIWIVLFNLIIDNIKSFVLINLRIRKKALLFFTIYSSQTILNGLLGYVLVVNFDYGLEGRMLAPLLSSIVMLPILLKILKSYTVKEYNFKLFLKNVKKAVPLVLAGYAYVPIVASDRFFLEPLNNLSELGLYAIGLTIAGYINLIFNALSSAFEPDIYKSVAANNMKKLIKTSIYIFTPYILIVTLYIIFSDKIVSILTANKYLGAVKYTNLIVIAIFFQGVFWYFDKIFIALEKNKLKLIVTIITSVIGIILMKYSVEHYNFIGAALAKIIISITMSLIAFLFVIYHLKQKIKISQINN